jgi:hypothetical protein
MGSIIFEEDIEVVIEKIAEYAIETEAPYEFIAAEFDVPVIIVEDCIKRAIAKDRIKYEKLNKIYDKSNQIESSIEDIERTYKAYNLVLRGYEIDDIVKLLNSDYKTINFDLTNRLNTFSPIMAKRLTTVFNNELNNSDEYYHVTDLDLLNSIEIKILTSATYYNQTGDFDGIISKYDEQYTYDIIESFIDILPLLDRYVYKKTINSLKYNDVYGNEDYQYKRELKNIR